MGHTLQLYVPGKWTTEVSIEIVFWADPKDLYYFIWHVIIFWHGKETRIFSDDDRHLYDYLLKISQYLDEESGDDSVIKKAFKTVLNKEFYGSDVLPYVKKHPSVIKFYKFFKKGSHQHLREYFFNRMHLTIGMPGSLEPIVFQKETIWSMDYRPGYMKIFYDYEQ